MNRREFIHPGQVVRTLTTPTGFSPVDAETATDSEQVSLVKYSRRAMAAEFEILLPLATSGSAAAAHAALDEIDRLEQQLSVYRDDSEVCHVNREAAARPVEVEQGLFDLLCLSQRLYEETEGAFDVTAGALIKAWGFFRGPRRVPSPGERRAALNRIGMRHVVLDRSERTVRFLRPGLELNFGSIGKGYALDRAAAVLRAGGDVTAAVFHGGRSSVLAFGDVPGEDRGWPVGLAHPHQPERRYGLVWLKDRALASSAATNRFLEWHGRRLGHVLDPRTGWPADRLAAATVVAPTAAQADALATAFYIMGVEPAQRYCGQHPDIGAILVPADAIDQPVIVGLDSDCCQLLDG